MNIEIDKLTNSIENTLTGEVFDTVIVRLSTGDAATLKITDWDFDWVKEIHESEKEVYCVSTVNNPGIIHGLLSLEDKDDHIFIHLIENSKLNKGKNKVYVGVPGNLVAFACKIAMEKGYDGFVAFDAKSKLIHHYEQTLGATHYRDLRMFIDTNAATRLISQYFK